MESLQNAKSLKISKDNDNEKGLVNRSSRTRIFLEDCNTVLNIMAQWIDLKNIEQNDSTQNDNL